MSTVILDFPPFYDHRIHSVYKMKGCNYTIIRRKGGPTETMIKESRKFREVRNNNGNFGAAAKAAGRIKNAIKPVKHLTNINNFGQLTSLCLNILKMDLHHESGERSVLFSKYAGILTGLNVNRDVTFESIFNTPCTCTITRAEGSATVTVPELIPKVNFNIPWDHPVYRIIIAIGVLPDIIKTDKTYDASMPGVIHKAETVITDWSDAKKLKKKETFVLQLPQDTTIDPSCSLIVSIGIEMGTYMTDTMVKPIPNIGCAKILMQG